MTKAWTCYDVNCPEDVAEELAVWIAERLAVSVEFTPAGIRFYIDRKSRKHVDVRAVKDLLEGFRRAFSLAEPITFSSSELAGDDWANRWKAYFRPLTIGSRLIVCPTWEHVATTGDEKVIHMNPGMAFGTGHHETTRLCLEWLDACGDPAQEGAAPRSLLDVGTGSGILAIGAALLGFDPVVGVDNDPEALEVARENARINGLEHRVDFVLSDQVEVAGKFHVVMANIQAGPLIVMSGKLVERLGESGKLVLSGILCEQQKEVQQAYELLGLRLQEVREAGEWCLLAFARKRKDEIA